MRDDKSRWKAEFDREERVSKGLNICYLKFIFALGDQCPSKMNALLVVSGTCTSQSVFVLLKI